MKEGRGTPEHSGLKMPTLWSGVARACSVVPVLGRMQVDQGCQTGNSQLRSVCRLRSIASWWDGAALEAVPKHPPVQQAEGEAGSQNLKPQKGWFR